MKTCFSCALALCFAFMLVEVAGGVLADSIAILADAAHVLSDVTLPCYPSIARNETAADDVYATFMDAGFPYEALEAEVEAKVHLLKMFTTMGQLAESITCETQVGTWVRQGKKM